MNDSKDRGHINIVFIITWIYIALFKGSKVVSQDKINIKQTNKIKKLSYICETLKICNQFLPAPPNRPHVKAPPPKHMNELRLTTDRSRLICDSPANFWLLSLSSWLKIPVRGIKSTGWVPAGRQVDKWQIRQSCLFQSCEGHRLFSLSPSDNFIY